MQFDSSGTFRYSPKLVGCRSEKWWLVIDCDPEIGRFYRSLYTKFHYDTQFLQRPSWKEHITVVRNEEPEDKSAWEKYNGQIVKFSYNPVIENDDKYFWLNVKCDFLFEIRLELGLNKDPEFPFHLTIGNKF